MFVLSVCFCVAKNLTLMFDGRIYYFHVNFTECVIPAFNFVFLSPTGFPGNNSDLIALVSSFYEEKEPVVSVM